MGFTYSLANSIGKVRFLVPDRDFSAYDLEDDEITYLLSGRGGDVKAAAVDACNWLARKYSKLASFTADGLTIQHTARAAEFAARAKELAAASQGGLATVDITRTDGYSEAAADGEYERRVIMYEV
jgi:hypothetical protein